MKDCTLDKLHEHIQTAIGWTRAHLHQFEINGQRHANPELFDDGFESLECIDSSKTMISDIVPKGRKRFAFKFSSTISVMVGNMRSCSKVVPQLEKGQAYPAFAWRGNRRVHPKIQAGSGDTPKCLRLG